MNPIMVKADFYSDNDHFDSIPEVLKENLPDNARCQRSENELTVSTEDSLRPVEISKTSSGYSLSMGKLAAEEDYNLFRIVVEACLKNFTDKAILDELHRFDDLSDVENFKWKEWTLYHMREDFDSIAERVKDYGRAQMIEYKGFNIYIGPRMMHECGNLDDLTDRIQTLKKRFKEEKLSSYGTPVGAIINEDNHSQKASVTLFNIDNAKYSSPEAPDRYTAFLRPAHALLLNNAEGTMLNVVRFSHTADVIPGAERLDDEQVVVKGPFTPQRVKEMLANIEIYKESNIFKDFMFPGRGFDEEQITWLLFWNIGESPVTPEDFSYWQTCMLAERSNWNVGDNPGVRIGDRWFLVARDADGVKGIVGSGIFDSNPWMEAKAQSSADKRRLFADLLPNCLVELSEPESIGGAELLYRFPGIDWKAAPSGTMLSDDEALQLEQLWGTRLARWDYMPSPHVRLIR